MKKALIILTMLMLALSAIPMVWSYTPAPRTVSTFMTLVVKDPTTWQEINKKTFAMVCGSNVKGIAGRYTITGLNLPKNTAFTLIYYGDATHNDVYPYATCLKSLTSTKFGTIAGTFNYDLASFNNDGINQKLWLVRSSDVDCTLGQMISWNPTNYLFEHATI